MPAKAKARTYPSAVYTDYGSAAAVDLFAYRSVEGLNQSGGRDEVGIPPGGCD
jgi:hypothetical protein